MTSTGRRGYVGIDRRWLNDPDLTDSALRLMLWLDSHTHEYLRDLSVKRASLEIGWSRDRVKRTLDILEELGLITTEQIPHPEGGKTRTQMTLHQSAWTEGYATRQGTRMPHGGPLGMPHGEAPTTSTKHLKESTLGNPQTPKGAVVSSFGMTFDEFWDLYPRKSAKPKAASAFKRKTKTPDEDLAIRNGLYSWIGFWEADGTEEQFIPHPTTFLNQERYHDTPPTPAEKKGAMSILTKLAARDHV